MKAKQVAFVAVTVFFRVVAVSFALWDVFVMGSQYLAMRMLNAGSPGPFGLAPVLLFHFAGAVLLWVLSKPFAWLSTRGLEVEPKS